MPALNFYVESTVTSASPEQYELKLHYADTTLMPLGPIDTWTITIGSPENVSSKIFETLEAGKSTIYALNNTAAIVAANTYFGDSRFTAGQRINSYQDFYSQAFDLANNVQMYANTQLAGKASATHVHEANTLLGFDTLVFSTMASIANTTEGPVYLNPFGKVDGGILPHNGECALYHDDMTSFPEFGEYGVLYLDASTGQAYFWDLAGEIYRPFFAPLSHAHVAADVTDFETEVDDRIAAQKGVANGVASLDSNSKIPTTQLPGLAITSVFTVSGQTAQLALTAQEGDIAVRTDLSKTYAHNGGTAGTMADWSELISPTNGVTSFNGRTGAVVPMSGDYSASDITGFTVSARAAISVTGSGSYSGATGVINIPPQISVYNGTSLVTHPKLIMKTGSTVSGGTVTFQLTANNTSTGTAILSNIHGINVDINSSAASYGYSWALTNSSKTLTLTVVQPGSLLGLGLIPFTAAASGVPVNVRVYGD